MTALLLPDIPFVDTASPLDLSRAIVNVLGIRLRVSGKQNIPDNVPMMVVSNHRSPLDGLVLMAALERDIAFVFHQYMEHVPVLRDVVHRFGAFPLESPRRFFREGCKRLRRHEPIGIFPEGAKSMVQLHPPREVNPFHRGFAHLALRAPVEPLALLPVALVSDDEGFESPLPLSILGWFDPSEPLFQQGGKHPLVVYRDVEIKVGKPVWITPCDRQQYEGRRGGEVAQQLTDQCWTTIDQLLH